MEDNLNKIQDKEQSTLAFDKDKEQLKIKWKKDREKRRDYLLKYHKHYYFKRLLEDKDYNKKNWEKKKAKGTNKR